MRHMVDHVGVVVAIDGADPLIHAAARANVLRRQPRSTKRVVDIRGDGAGFIKGETVVPQDWYAVKRMQRQMLRLAHHRFKIVEGVGHVLVREHEPYDVHKGASWKTKDDRVGHRTSLS